MDNLDFVNSIDDNINYREDQKDLIQKAMEISNGDPLNALQYFVTCMNHEEYDIEFELVFTIPANEEVTITLPIIETEPKDELGYYVSWGNKITHNISVRAYEKIDKIKDYHIRFFGLGISGFGMHSQEGDNEGYKKYLTKVISFGRLGHTFTSLEYAFYKCQNNFTVPRILPSNITNMSSMFGWSIAFNQPLEWDTSNVINMSSMFSSCTNFNQPLEWNTSNVTDMSRMFCCCTNFNQPLELNTSNVTNMCHMFIGCTKFNQPLEWNTSNVTNMRSMFYDCTNFNQPLEWDTSNVTDMNSMFIYCYNFNQPLTAWNTSNVIYMDSMFFCCTRFNQPLTAWNTSNVINMSGMFNSCTNFNQSLTEWDTTNVLKMWGMFSGCNISEENKPRFLNNL